MALTDFSADDFFTAGFVTFDLGAAFFATAFLVTDLIAAFTFEAAGFAAFLTFDTTFFATVFFFLFRDDVIAGFFLVVAILSSS
jgi:hypothetical protein